jgi:hypothetical protein
MHSRISGHAINKILKCNGPGPDLAQTKTGFGEVPDSTGKQTGRLRDESRPVS